MINLTRRGSAQPAFKNGCTRFSFRSPPPAACLCRRALFLAYILEVSGPSILYANVRILRAPIRLEGDPIMSLNLIAGVDFPSQLPSATAPFFLLGRNAAGHWVIRETTGRRAGLFRTRQAAIKYARDETWDGNFIIVEQLEGLELEPRHIKRAA
jgi:hypothetical protein